MISYSELRIANYLQDSKNKIFQVWNINSDGYLNKGYTHSKMIGSCSGILLTEEILLKCGFEKITHYTVMNNMTFDLDRNRYLSIGCVGTPNETLWLTSVEKGLTEDLICLHNFDYDGKLYLHKLQNIVSIFNKELNQIIK